MSRAEDKQKRNESYTRAMDKSRDQGRLNRVAGTESLRFLTDDCSLSEDTGDRTRAERHAASPTFDDTRGFGRIGRMPAHDDDLW